MRRIIVRGDVDNLAELKAYLPAHGLELKRKVQLNLNENEIIHYITVGGGALGLAQCIVSFLKLKFQKRKLTIVIGEKKISAEGCSVEEVAALLDDAREFVISDEEN